MPGPYPLATLSATVDENGISAPPFADIFASLQASYRIIYGADVDLDEDTQDGQWLGVLAKAIDDANLTAIKTYLNFSPATAVGVGLSSVVKVNGIRRHSSTTSQADVRVVGQANRTVVSGVIGDNVNAGTTWALPPTFTFPDGGELVVRAVCEQPGAVEAAAGTLTEILTPQPGWQTVTNDDPAIVGAPVEADAALRQRQSISTAKPAQTPREAIEAEVADVADVVRVHVYQNDTNLTDANAIPAHNISVVVAGGDTVAIATAINLKKPPGTPTYGIISQVVFDSMGVPNTINFFELDAVSIWVRVYATHLTGYVGTTGLLMIAAVVESINLLAIGAVSGIGRLWAAADLAGTAATLATGATQTQLDALSATYKVERVEQARSDMVVFGGPYGAGSTTINVTNASNYATGASITVELDNGSLFTTTVTGVTGTAVSFSPGVPGSRSIPNGRLVYVAGDVAIEFNAAGVSSTAKIALVVA